MMIDMRRILEIFAKAQQGNVVMIFALSLFPIIAVAGAAIDINRVQTAKMQTASLLDQAVLAATNLSSTDEPTILVQTWMDSQIEQFGYRREDLSVQVNSVVALNSKSVTATASLTVDTAVMHVFGAENTTIQVSSSAMQSIPNIEIAMVLDISSSMRGNRLSSLKAASTEFVDIMLNETTEDATSINIVPFGGTVNIGASLFNKFAVETTGFGTVIDPDVAAYDIGTSVETSDFRFTAGHECIEAIQTDYSTGLLPNNSRGQVPDFWRWWNNHPWCPEASSAVFLNSNDATALKSHLNGMVLSDGTGMDIGTLWGLKSLSPSFRGILGGDFSDRPLAFDADESKKVMIVMTDGAITAQNRPEDISIGNVHTNRPTNNAPHASAYSNQGNRGNMQTTRTRGNANTTSANNSAVGRFKKACEAAKSENILVFTIGFQIRAGSLPDKILAECATSSAYYYHVEGLDLTSTFQSIASQVNALRLTQ
ncbi:MAG: TadE/TadG family type IV pilus assembly protein [Pseudomonadota bacterium]